MTERVPLGTIAKSWTRLGCIGFGGPPTHIALLRRMCVDENKWLDGDEFEDGIATTNLLPGPASTQLAIFSAWRVGGPAGALIGGLGFIVPGLALILVLSAVFLAGSPPVAVLGAAAGAGAAVPAVALHAARTLVPSSWARIGTRRAERARWVLYGLAGGVVAATVGPFLVLALIACGLIEVTVRRGTELGDVRPALVARAAAPTVAAGGLAALAWVAFKVGALSYGGGFVIIPLMQHDAVHAYHWMTDAQFLNAVALGQVTPGPVVLTVATVGYAAAGVGGGLARRGDRVRSFFPLRPDRRPSLLSAPRQPVGAGVPHRCRTCGDRRDRGVDDPPRARPRALVAGPDPGGRARRPAPVASRRRRHDPGSRRRRPRRRVGRRARSDRSRTLHAAL